MTAELPSSNDLTKRAELVGSRLKNKSYGTKQTRPLSAVTFVPKLTLPMWKMVVPSIVSCLALIRMTSMAHFAREQTAQVLVRRDLTCQPTCFHVGNGFSPSQKTPYYVH